MEVYLHDGKIYLFNDSVVNDYSFDTVDHDRYSLDEAIAKARESGKKHLIHMKAEGYEMINLE